MADFITLTCPTCGGKLQITDTIYTFACTHCGTEHLVHREGGAIYLAPLAQDVRQMRIGVDKTAAELAIVRLQKEIDELEARLKYLSVRYAGSIPPARKRLNDSHKGWLLALLIALICLGPLLALWAAEAGNTPILWSSLGMSLFSFAVAIRVATIKAAATNEPTVIIPKTTLKVEIDNISAELKAKRTQLQKNQQIANG